MSDQTKWKLSGNSGIPQPLTPVRSLGHMELRLVDRDDPKVFPRPSSRTTDTDSEHAPAKRIGPHTPANS